jgi:hypothetical protein
MNPSWNNTDLSVINHKGQIFIFQYANSPEKFDDYDSEQQRIGYLLH